LDTSIERQSDYLIDLHGNLIVDFVGRYERLHGDFADVCGRIGIRCPELPHRRQATDRRKDYRSYYERRNRGAGGESLRRRHRALRYAFDPPGGA